MGDRKRLLHFFSLALLVCSTWMGFSSVGSFVVGQWLEFSSKAIAAALLFAAYVVVGAMEEMRDGW